MNVGLRVLEAFKSLLWLTMPGLTKMYLDAKHHRKAVYDEITAYSHCSLCR